MQEDGRCRLPRSALKQLSLKFWDLLRVTRFSHGYAIFAYLGDEFSGIAS